MVREDKRRHEQKFIEMGLRIANYRKIKGFSQMKLAEMVGISRTHLSNIEAPHSVTHISLNTLFDICDILDISVTRLLDFDD